MGMRSLNGESDRKGKMTEKLRLAVFGHKRWSREGGVEIVVKELCTRMAQQGCQVTCYNRSGHHVSSAEYDDAGKTEYEGIRQKSVPTIQRRGARDIIRGCHNRDKGTAENERLRNPKFIFSYPKNTLNSVIKNGAIDLSSVEITEDEIKNFEQIYIVACGSAWHVGMAAQYVLEDIADIPVRVELASEFRYRKMPLNQKALVIVVSQSGETADTLAALRLAKEKGITTMAIVNVVGSSIAREADKVFYTLAGPEISVATTKAYSAQLAAMYCLAVQFAKVREKITEEQYSYYISELLTLPEKMQKTLEDKERIQWFAAKYANAHDVFFVGRGIDYAVCLEGSLKLKEISYIHSEAYAAGELKHGTISLIERGTLVIGVLTQSELYEKTISNMLECKSRGAYLMGLTTYGKYEIEDQVNFTVYVPKGDEHFVGSLAVIPLQLLGYYVSVAKGLDVDKPRNLAKSVTVE